MIGAIISLISFVSLCLYVFADVKLNIIIGSFFIGATQFEKGLPVPVELSYQFPPADLRRDTIGIRAVMNIGLLTLIIISIVLLLIRVSCMCKLKVH